MTVILHFATAVLAFAAGWFLAAIAITNGLKSDIRKLDRERQELDDEREALAVAWTTTEPPVILDLGAHKRIRVS